MKVLGIIPARYNSSRFPGKPLASICGKSMIQRVYQQVALAPLNKVIVATDDQRILSHVLHFGGEALHTKKQHPNGTSRCLEVVETLENNGLFFDIILNIQGDEPLLKPEQIEQLMAMFKKKETDIATLAYPISRKEDLFDPNVVKVVTNTNNKALYFSRQAIPFFRDEKPEVWLQHTSYLKHVGIYAFRTQVLKEIVGLPAGRLENAEKLEQLRWLEKGYSINIETTDYEGIGVDTPADLQKLMNKICKEQQQ